VLTTKMETILDGPIELLTGDEEWPILGNAVTEDQAHLVVRVMAGLPRHWACDVKAFLACLCLGFPPSAIKLGSLMVFSSDLKSSYGHFYNLPFEFHAWIEPSDGIVIDFALPGVIEKALMVKDKHGSLVIGRDPVVLAGKPPAWLQYVDSTKWEERNEQIP
jgi:hypothetical protein